MIGAALENFPLKNIKNTLFNSTYTIKIVRTSRADWAFSQLPLSPILSNTMFIKIDSHGKEFARTIPQAHGIGDVVAWGPHLCVQLRCQNHKFATPGGEKPPTEHTTINATTIHLLHVGRRIFFPVVLLCQFLVLVGNRFWFYILLMYLECNTVVVLC